MGDLEEREGRERKGELDGVNLSRLLEGVAAMLPPLTPGSEATGGIDVRVQVECRRSVDMCRKSSSSSGSGRGRRNAMLRSESNFFLLLCCGVGA